MTVVSTASRFTGAIVEYFDPDEHLTFTVATTAVSGGNMVELNGDRTVQPAGAASLKCVGIALHDAAVGETVSVAAEGTWPAVASGAIAAGDLLTCDTGGKVVTLAAAGGAYAQAAANGSRAIVGIALEAISDTAKGRVRLKNLS